MTSVDLAVPERALAIGAHPDDVEFGCGATLAKWAAAGCEITHLICTDGSKGTWDRGADLANLVEARRLEQQAANKALGGTGDVIFLGFVDGELTSGLAARSLVAEWIRRTRPDVVLGHDPWKMYRFHPDHRHAGLLAVEGVVAARDPHFYPEHGLEEHRPATVLLFEAEAADHVEIVDEPAFDARIDALLAHESQLESTMEVDAASPEAVAQFDAFKERERQKLQEMGALVGASLGEAFKLLEP
ncbi:MAG: Mycothiol S-conjugate amidase [Acidimicrobiales bacterium]|nr:MAG: PIG-L family deacetylase [Actinomycetota bacterium]MBV6508327.1 Mycothiol S-conjugate amidase [Acidimicrobiales bacterium]RIK07108.1 MAG: PIG-L family deacetylase [Acidobacteriota bacterium]